MSLAKIREYQEIDLEIYREENKILRSNEVQRMSAVQQQMSKAEQNLLKMDKETESAFAELERLETKLSELSAKEKTHYSFSSVVSIEQLDNIENALNEYSEEISSLEREIKKIFRRLDEINAGAGKQFDLGKNLQRERSKLRIEYNKLYEDFKEKYKDQLDKLQALRAEIKPSLFAAYKNLRDNRKMPAFVAYSNGVCSGCGMEVKADVDAKINSPGDLAECPNCRRILFK